MPAPLLYTYRRCPYAMRARMALLQAGVVYQAHEVSLRDKPPAMLARSPKGTVPVLVLSNGMVLEQSLDIMRWAFEQSGDTDLWWARSQTSSNLVLQQVCDGLFKYHLDRYKYPQRFTDAVTREHHFEQAVAVLLNALEQLLQTQPQIGGASACATDIGIFPFVRQFAGVDPERFESLPLPALKAWLAAWLESGLFTEVMRKPSLMPSA